MKPENIAVLEKYIQHWHRIKFIGDLNMPMYIREQINKVYEDELKPNIKESLWCGTCVINMMKNIYNHYERTAPKPILENTLVSTTFYPNGQNQNNKPPRKPRKPKNDKG